ENDILLFGRESSGVPDPVHDAADARLLIPMMPGARSLNLAISVAMTTGEALRQRKSLAKGPESRSAASPIRSERPASPMILSMRPAALAASVAGLLASAPAFAKEPETIKPKVMVITMFGEEAKPWLDDEKFTQKIKLPGLNPEYPEIDCTAEGLCHMT